MSSSLYEIAELATGEIVLKRSDEDANAEPLVVIRFSPESIAFLGANRFEVAKAMIETGMEIAGDLAEIPDDFVEESADYVPVVLH